MPNDIIDTRELEAMIRRLDTMPTVLGAEMGAAARMGAEELRAYVAKYPAATAANAPPGINGYSWYERGFGTRTTTGKGYPTSEALGRSWAIQTMQALGRWTGIALTGVSYAHWVHDAMNQAGFHAARGWRTTEDAIRERKAKIERIISRAISRALTRLGGM